MDQENSVVVAISELRKIEQQRIADEAKAKERERIEREKAQALRQAEQDRARRLAEEETRKRFALDLQRRDAEADAQIASLKAELAAVQAARQEIRLRLLAGYPTRIADIKSSRSRLKFLCALAVGSAMTLLGVHFLSPSDSQTNRNESEHSEQRDESNRVERPDTVYPIVRTDIHSDAHLPAPRPDKVQPETPAPKKYNDKSGKRPKQRRDKIKDTKTTGDILNDLEECGDDPTCGLPLIKDKRRIVR